MPRRALLVDEFLESEDIRRMDWPARAPDLNSIQYIWHALGRAIATRNPSDNYPGNENSVTEQVGPIATRTDKLPYFKYDTLRGLYSCKRVSYPYKPISFVYSATAVSYLQTTMSVTHDHACVLQLLNGYFFCFVSVYVRIKFH
ncbi:DDE_3 domain-containing protein [Trichonephila clavipes]|nr:DDE_3 domain-containing protein [Trichonephila clavipes]